MKTFRVWFFLFVDDRDLKNKEKEKPLIKNG